MKNRQGKQFELAGLIAALDEVVDESADEIRDHILAATRAWMRVQHDDLTVVVARRQRTQ